MRKREAFVGVLMAFLLLPKGAAAAVIAIPESAFLAGSGLITFSEVPLGTVNPTYPPALYGGGAGAPTVTFEGYFLGQALGTVATCPAGAAVTGCVVGNPSNPLTLAAAAPNTSTVNDAAAGATSPVLSGSPTFNGPIAILFSIDQAGVGLKGGFFDAIGGTAITAYSRTGADLGTVTNTATGFQFLGLVTDDGSAQIAGLLFHLVGPEPAGFEIDNIRFGAVGQVTVPGAPIPEPTSVLLLGSGAVGLARRWRRRK